MLIQPAFGAKYHTIKCIDTKQAKKLMAEMQTALQNATVVKGSNSKEIIFSYMNNSKETAELLRCLQNSAPKTVNTAYVADIYKKIAQGQPKTKVDVLL